LTLLHLVLLRVNQITLWDCTALWPLYRHLVGPATWQVQHLPGLQLQLQLLHALLFVTQG
jgi:hypothetical protein